MKVSFCITCYNKDVHFLDKLLRTLEEQTKAPFEVIVSSSGMRNLELPAELVIAGKSVPVIGTNSEEKIIQSVARNRAIKKSSGDIVIFFDVDDMPHPQKIEVTQNIFSKGEAEALVHSYSRNGTPFKPIENEDVVKITEKNPTCTNLRSPDGGKIHHAHIAVKKEVLRSFSFNETLEYYRLEDGKFCQDLFDAGVKIYYLNQPLVKYT
jgi:glycosyltransferase involved in cell wall biosynthesis